MRGDGRVFKPKKSRFWHVAYYGVRSDGSLGEIRESAKTENEEVARRFLRRRLANAIVSREALRRFAAGQKVQTSAKTSLDSATKIAGNPTWQIDSAMFSRLVGPIVYAWARGEEVLYVGMSANGISRPFRLSHHRGLKACCGEGRLFVWPCATAVDAYQLEAEMIRRLRPQENRSVPKADSE